MGTDQDISNLIQKFNQQQQRNPKPQMPKMPQQPQIPIGNQYYNGIDNQGQFEGAENFPQQNQPLVTNQVVNPNQYHGAPPKPAAVPNECPQCGMSHPPIKPGEKCPLTLNKVEVKDEKEEKVIDVNKFLVNLQNILLSQISQKKIKDVEKLYKNIIINTTKFLEAYKE